MKTDKIKIGLVDDHALVRDAVATMLQQMEDMEVIGTASSGEEMLNKFDDLNPDVILMDIMLPGMTGIEATKWIKDRHPNLRVILLSSETRKEFLTAGIQTGIDGYLTKDVEKATLIHAIRQVAGGKKYFNEAITALVFDDFYRKSQSGRMQEHHLKISDLTKREVEVLTLIASGKSNKEVADELFISVKTVDTHKSHILDKLGLENVAQLVKYAIKNNLIADF